MAFELQRALSQIEEIHAQMARSEVFRGYRAVTMAATGCAAFAGAAIYSLFDLEQLFDLKRVGFLGVDVQSFFSSLGLYSTRSAVAASWEFFVLYWSAIALVCLVFCFADLLIYRKRTPSNSESRRTLLMIGQFLPALLSGGLLTALFVHLDRVHLDRSAFDPSRATEAHPGLIPLLPGLWAVIYGLGIFASRPYLPRAIGGVGLFYVIAGLLQLWAVGSQADPDPWTMGITFALGQWALALVLYLNLERPGALDGRAFQGEAETRA